MSFSDHLSLDFSTQYILLAGVLWYGPLLQSNESLFLYIYVNYA